MKTLTRALEDSLSLLQSGQATIEECLARHPHLRNELEPLLRTSQRVAELPSERLSVEFVRRGRAKLQAQMAANPHHPSALSARWARFSPGRLVATIAMLVLAVFATGTALAQSALPGQFLYGWKLSTDRIWIALVGETPQGNLNISTRRFEEYWSVRGDLGLEAEALGAYTSALQALMVSLESDGANVATVYQALLDEQTQLHEAGIQVPELDDAVEQLSGRVSVPELPGEAPGGDP